VHSTSTVKDTRQRWAVRDAVAEAERMRARSSASMRASSFGESMGADGAEPGKPKRRPFLAPFSEARCPCSVQGVEGLLGDAPRTLLPPISSGLHYLFCVRRRCRSVPDSHLRPASERSRHMAKPPFQANCAAPAWVLRRNAFRLSTEAGDAISKLTPNGLNLGASQPGQASPSLTPPRLCGPTTSLQRGNPSGRSDAPLEAGSLLSRPQREAIVGWIP
jgi:hypothetical protein